MTLGNIAINILNALLSGIYAVSIYVLITRFVSVKNKLAIFGIFNKWLILAFLLYTFGTTKHNIGYMLTIESSYCETNGVCDTILKDSTPSLIETIKTYILSAEGLWVESAGEGILFILVGLPTFVYCKNKLVAALITGMLAHLVAEYFGFHKYFCKRSCSLIPSLTI